ncbi:hypothetical protein A6770_28060 [Nostoc minutum NIES-26]|uniref:GIY-YIG domain-containing protein n=1 Tax=Nostoc minutum NIES-26 TaxID=1844469 RepID=A0A367QLX4_9NOSO|nr:hypothetical protein A6770_28060 [Nostoc minutum NIES-26]
MYIGETEDIYKRLLQHKHKNKYEFWTDTYFISTKKNILHRGNIQYLEYKFIELAKKSNNIDVFNKKGYCKIPNLIPSDQQFTEYFFNYCKDLLAKLGLEFE